MATTITRNGYGQVEPNHLSAPRTGQVYAQLPADSSIEVLENGMFAVYNYAESKVTLPGADATSKTYEPFLVYNEVKLYEDDAHMQFYKDFALKASDFIGGVMTPRLLKINVGDIFTTNCFEENKTTGAGPSLSEGDPVYVGADGYLTTTENEDCDIVFHVAKVYTMPDAQPGVKLVRVK